MNKNFKIFLLGLAVIPMACTGNYLNINTDPYEVSKEDMATDGYDVGSAMAAIASTVISTDVNTAQFTDCLLGGPMGHYYSSTIGSETTFDNYNPSPDWFRVFMSSDKIIPKLYSNYRELRQISQDPVALAIADIMKVAAMHRVTDTYGAIPYSQIGKDGKLTIPYDSQDKIYEQFFTELDAAIKVLTDNQQGGISPFADPVYNGSAVQWCKFANSLKLRLAMRIVYADPENARKYAEEAVNHPLGVITSNADIAQLKPANFGDKGNPLYTAIKYNQVQGTQTGGDTHVAADITCYMNGYEDPRREAYFIPSLFPEQKYCGMRIGIERPALTTHSYKYSGVNITPQAPLVWMNAAEVAFLKAEAQAVFNFNMGGSAEDFYNEGIRLSFNQWGVSGAEEYLSNDENIPSVYTDPLNMNSSSQVLSKLPVKWNMNASPEEMQERILIQKWIANYNLGNEAWADYRRTGYPHFIPASKEGNKSNGKVDSELGARRMPYPQEEYTNNNENVCAAVDATLGGKDTMGARIWWDCNPAIWNEK